jgi:dihydrofolate synthase/folylpolyglutamate synthase
MPMNDFASLDAPGEDIAASRPDSRSSLADWLAHLEEIHPRTIELGLARVGHVRERLGLLPHFPVITVGGTNGKGSVCAMLESILLQAGYRVGCYTSPHLVRYNERVRIGGREAADTELVAAFAAVDQARGETPLTYFEFGTLAAMKLFTDDGVDVAVLEVGLGGRLDAVNVFEPDCAIVVTVDMDHMNYLGDTREAIAFEKAGIFRGGKPAIYGEERVPETLRAHAQQIGARLIHVGDQIRVRTSDPQQWEYEGPGGRRSGLPHPALRGAYQLTNAAVCIACLDELREKLPVSAGDIRNGLAYVRLPGRFQVLAGRPVVIFDVAHNPHAAAALARNLQAMGRFRATYAVFGMLHDKDFDGVIEKMAGAVDYWLVADIGAARGAAASELAAALRARQVSAGVECFTTPGEAFDAAEERAGPDDRIVTFGSFLTVADVMRRRFEKTGRWT